MYSCCSDRIYYDGDPDTAFGSSERDHKKYSRCKYISGNVPGRCDLIKSKTDRNSGS